jgi:hypothetical protein
VTAWSGVVCCKAQGATGASFEAAAEQCMAGGLTGAVRWAQEAEVRAAACRALLGLYAEERNKATLHEFTRRFSPRFQEIIYDIDQAVAVLGVSSCWGRWLACVCIPPQRGILAAT